MCAEIGFTSLTCMTCAMMNKADDLRAIRYKLFGKVTKTATKLNSLIIVVVNGVKKM
jgi:hypothetical protein